MRKLMACLLFLPLIACGNTDGGEDGETPTSERKEVEVASVVIESEDLQLSLNETASLRAHAVDANGTRISREKPVWSSTADSIARVTPEGVVIAVGVGTAMIQAEAGGVVGEIQVDVAGEGVASIEVAPVDPEPIAVGAVVRIAVSMFDRLHAPITDPRDISFTSTDESVLTVSEEGVVRAKSEGTATVEVEVEGLTGSVTFTVIPPAIRGVELEQDTTYLVPGDTATLVANVRWTDDVRPDFEPNITWVSSNPEVAAIDAATGEVTALKEGRVSVTVTVEGSPFEFANAVEVVFDFGAISAGGSHVCGLVLDVAYCWGANDAGQLGRASGTEPARVDTELRFKKIVAGGEHSCGLTEAGEIYCWGDSSTGQLGGGRTSGSATPQLVDDTMQFKSVVAGESHTCALTINDELYCWGDGSQGRLGTGMMGMQPTATLVGNYVSVSTGYSHSCALTPDGEAHCWGSNARGQLGLMTTDGPQATPQLVKTAYDLTTIVTGVDHTCAITIGGETLCWGGNGSGQVGDGTIEDRTAAVLVSPNILDRRLTSGPLHTCGLTRLGEVQCWGEGDDGRLGTGSTADVLEPQVIEGSRTYFTVDAGEDFTCAISTGSDPYCWGAGAAGQLGSGSNGSNVPVRVTGF